LSKVVKGWGGGFRQDGWLEGEEVVDEDKEQYLAGFTEEELDGGFEAVARPDEGLVRGVSRTGGRGGWRAGVGGQG